MLQTNPSQDQLRSLIESYQLSKFSETEDLAIAFILEFPQNQIGWKVLGAVQGQLGKHSKALKANRKAVELSPQDVEAHANLGNTLKELGRLEEARESYNKAIAFKADIAQIHYNLGITLQKMGKLKLAEESYIKAIAINQNYAEAHNNLGIVLRYQGRLEEALARYLKALALKPDYSEALNNLGIISQELGNLEEAKKNFNQALSLKPDFAKANLNLTFLKKFNSKDEQYLNMEKLYLDESITDEELCYINFGLAKACEDLGDFEKAYMHYNKGNSLRKKLLKYKIGEDKKFFKQIKDAFVYISKNSLEYDQLSNSKIPIFIIGMPRSGTTLVEHIISSHINVSAMGEIDFISQLGKQLAIGTLNASSEYLQDFRKKYLEQFNYITGKNSFVTDKTPQNFLYLGLISAAFPEAKIVHVMRNPAAVCWSNYKQYFDSETLGYPYDLQDIMNYYRLYENLMQFWNKFLNNRIYNLNYEVLVKNQETETRKLIDYLGLDWDEKCLMPQNNNRSVATASNIQVRKKVYKDSSIQWKKYKPFLKGIFDKL